jgi:hypothetical protein
MPRVDLASRLNLIQIVLWTALALWVLPSRGHFLYDEAYFYHQAIEVARHGVLPVHGPPISGSAPVAFTPGGGLYLALAVPFVFGTDPRLGVAWIILLSSLGLWLFDRALKAHGADPLQRVFTIAVLTWTNWHARLVDRIWNNHVYWWLSLALLAVTLHLIRRPPDRARLLMALFGALSALSLQAHLQGALAVAACLVLLLTHPQGRRPLRHWFPCGLAFALLYAPYVFSEAAHGLHNTAALQAAHAFAGWNREAVLRGLLSPVLYASGFTGAFDPSPTLGQLLPLDSWWSGLRTGLLLLSIGVSAFFFARPGPFRIFLVVCWAIVPVYFLLNQRDYHYHYVASLIPYFAIPLGWGLAGVFRKGRVLAATSVVFLGVWVVAQTLSWAPGYLANVHVPTLGDQLARAEQAALASTPRLVYAGDADAFVLWSLAGDCFQRVLWFRVAEVGRVCLVKVGTPAPGLVTADLSIGSYYLCPQ